MSVGEFLLFGGHIFVPVIILLDIFVPVIILLDIFFRIINIKSVGIAKKENIMRNNFKK